MKIYTIFLWLSVSLACPYVFADWDVADQRAFKYCVSISEAYDTEETWIDDLITKRTYENTGSRIEHNKKWRCTFYLMEGYKRTRYRVYLKGWGVNRNANSVENTANSRHILSDLVPVAIANYSQGGRLYFVPLKRINWKMFIYVYDVDTKEIN